MMTRSGVGEVPLPSVRTAADDLKDGAALPMLPPPRATGDDIQSETSLPHLQGPIHLNSETDKEKIVLEGKDSKMRAPSPLSVMRGWCITSVAIVLLTTICFFPSVWLEIGV